MEFVKDFENPMTIENLENNIKNLREYAKRGTEQACQVQSRIFGAQNSLKVRYGLEGGFKNPEFMAQKKREQDDFIKAINANPETAKDYLAQFHIVTDGI